MKPLKFFKKRERLTLGDENVIDCKKKKANVSERKRQREKIKERASEQKQGRERDEKDTELADLDEKNIKKKHLFLNYFLLINFLCQF